MTRWRELPFVWCTGIEDTFVAQEGPGRRRLDEYELQQHYRFWREDVDLAADTGFDMIRYGIPWYRVEPEPGRFDWSFTDLVMPYIVQRGMKPIVDLVHYGTPLWLEGQFVNDFYPTRVAAYAAAFAQRYGGLVQHYTPLNEPFINAELCGRTGRWPPNLTGDSGFVRVIGAIAEGIVRTVRAVKEAQPDAIMVHVEATGIGSTNDVSLAERLQLDLSRERLALDLITGRVDESHDLYRYLIEHGTRAAQLETLRRDAIALDVLGLNYYPFMSVWHRSLGEDSVVRQEARWGGGEALESVVREYYERYGAPLFVTECSHNERAVPGSTFGAPPYAVGPPGAARSAWLDESVATLRRLLAGGVPLVGFTWWPLYDLINWDYREGELGADEYLEPMGLFALRMDESGTFQREPLSCADRMRDVIESWRGEHTDRVRA